MGHRATRATAEVRRKVAGVQRCVWEQENGGKRWQVVILEAKARGG